MHPISRTMEEIAAIFGAMGCEIAEGPDIEFDWMNFSALNIPAHHPARADHDTFYLPAQRNLPPPVLRTHTSPGPDSHHAGAPSCPFGSSSSAAPIAPTMTPRTGRCSISARAWRWTATSLGHLKGSLIDFLRSFFGIADLPVRFRSSYFPFTEPSMEVDIGWDRRIGRTRERRRLARDPGSGMVHPRVLANCGIDPREWQGFAFGMGVERIAMLKYGITDLRPFFKSDIRWLRIIVFHRCTNHAARGRVRMLDGAQSPPPLAGGGWGEGASAVSLDPRG